MTGGNNGAHCPDCISFLDECNPDAEDYDSPCPYYKPREGFLDDGEVTNDEALSASGNGGSAILHML